MSRTDTVFIETGTANLASVRAALDRLGLTPRPARRARDVREARRVVLPGVGSFAATASGLARHGLDAAVRERLTAGRPLLAVCVGLQLLATDSAESPGARGLGVLPCAVARLDALPDAPDDVRPRLPHHGWNVMEVPAHARMLLPGAVAYANSFAMPAVALRRGMAARSSAVGASAGLPASKASGDAAPAASDDAWRIAVTNHGGEFVAGVERGPILGCQFHPELSGALGAEILDRWRQESDAC